MAYQRRGSVPTNTIKLTLDFDTLDRLKTAASARKVDTTRCAYELIQEALGVRSIPLMLPAPAEEPDPISETVKRGLDAVRNYNKPGGSL